MNSCSNECIIRLENISKFYCTDNKKIAALDNINLKVNKGDFLSICGDSGSGKSTLMNIMGFIDKPSSGKYYFEGRDSLLYSEREISEIRGSKIGFIFQGFNLLPNLTAYENVELPLLYSKVSRNLRKEKVEFALNKVGLSERMNHRPYQLSGGQKQRIAIARALVISPCVILADEPTGNLDKNSGDIIINYLSEINKDGTTVIIITHDMQIASRIRNKITISNGKSV